MMNSILFVFKEKWLSLDVGNKIMEKLGKNLEQNFFLKITKNEKLLFEKTVKFVGPVSKKREYRSIKNVDDTNTNILKNILGENKSDPRDIHLARFMVQNEEIILQIDIYSPENSKYEHLKNLLLYDGKSLDQTTTVNEKWFNRILELPKWVQI